MKRASLILAALGCLAVTLPMTITPADAYVRRYVRAYRGPYGHLCRRVRTVVRVPGHYKRVYFRRRCY